MLQFSFGKDHLTGGILQHLWDGHSGGTIESSTWDSAARSYLIFQNLAQSQESEIYGFHTNLGGNADQKVGVVSDELYQKSVARYLDCSVGKELSYEVCMKALYARLHVLAKGYSGITPQTLATLYGMSVHQIAPVLKSQGSLGASGDLVTLAALARAAGGDDVPVYTPKGIMGCKQAFHLYGIEHTSLRGRDALGISNGLSLAASFLCVETQRSSRIFFNSLVSMMASSYALRAHQDHLEAFLHDAPVRQHVAQKKVSQLLRRYLWEASLERSPGRRRQDEYSIRCLPQALAPQLIRIEESIQTVEGELNSISDNPILSADGQIFHGGNFFGGMLTKAADDVSLALHGMGQILDAQSFLLVDGRHDLPTNLVHPGSGDHRHALKGVHQVMNALMMELSSNAMPHQVFSKSSENHNQDIVSNCMNAALRVETMNRNAALLLSCHAALASAALELCNQPIPKTMVPFLEQTRSFIPFSKEDQGYRDHLTKFAEALSSGLKLDPMIQSP